MSKPTQEELKAKFQAQAARNEAVSVYAEQVGAVNFGPYVSKIHFVDNHDPSGDPTSVLHLTIPTPALLEFAAQALKVLSSEDVAKSFKENYKIFTKALEQRSV